MDAVSFDLDGTLVRSSEPRERSLEHVRETVYPALPRLSADTYQAAFRDALAERLPNAAWELPVRRTAFERAFDAAEIVPSAATLEAFALVYRRRRLERLVPRDGAAEILLQIRRRGGAVVVVTNGPAGLQQEKLLRTGLAEYVDAMVVAGRCGAMKPDPEPFGVGLERVGASADGTIHVGDSPRDVEGALRAGLEPIVLDPNADENHDADGVPRCPSLAAVYRRFLD